ncbi:MAG: hypothetical protein JO006_15445 [Paucibacter sp.]|nr:hypothetical protein [Roseateles sp.]
MDTKLIQFIDELVGAKVQAEKQAERENERRSAFEGAMKGLADKKDEIRKAMQVQLVDKDGKKHEKSFSDKGQEHAIDTARATRQGRGLSKEDMQQVGEALRPIAEAARALLDQRDREGRPLFDTPEAFQAALRDELFTPLVREGVLPENFVIDKYSEVQQLLDETFKAYKQSTREHRDDKAQEDARQKSLRSGSSGSRLEKAGANLKALAAIPDKALARLHIDETKKRRIGIAVAGVQMGLDMYKMGTTLDSWNLEANGKAKIVNGFDKQLHPSGPEVTETDPDRQRLQMAYKSRRDGIADKLGKLGLTPDQQQLVLKAVSLDEKPTSGQLDTLRDLGTSKTAIPGYGDSVVEIIKGLALPGLKLDKVNDALKLAHHEAANAEAADRVAHQIDARLVALLDKHVRPGVGTALKGAYVDAIDTQAVAEAAAQAKPEDQIIIGEFGAAFERVLSRNVDPALGDTGKELAKKFINAVNGPALQKAVMKDPDAGFAPLLRAAEELLNAELPTLPADRKALIDAGVLRAGLQSLAVGIDKALCEALVKAVSVGAGEAFASLYASNFKAAVATPPNGQAVVDALADCFEIAFVRAAPNPSDASFLNTGKALAAAYKKKADAALFVKLAATDLVGALGLLQAAADAAIGEAMHAQGASLRAVLSSTDSLRALASKAVYPGGDEEAMKELQAADEELDDYRRQLVLIDEGGIGAADLHSIERLIEQIEQDRLTADIVLSVGNVLTGLGSTSMSIAGAVSVNVTDTLVGEVVGPLKAAKLVMKFAVAVKQANERRLLLEKFKKSLKLSKKAVSPLQSTIQGFFDNKVEQMAFHAIEDALTLVQIAAAVVGSVPEPITMAVSKTMGAIAEAGQSANKFAGMVYNEVMLAAAWKSTLAFIRAPHERAAGLEALRLNPTLGMHAIAWAGMEKKPLDPIARNLLSELGLNEQTLMASGTEAKVRRYLETLLPEDRSLYEPDKVTPDWEPRPLEFTVESWSVAVTRAWREAEPKLKKSTERAVLEQFKIVDAQDLVELATRAQTGAIEAAELEQLQLDAEKLSSLLRAYTPISADGSLHSEMANVAASFIKMSGEHEAALAKLVRENLAAQARDATRVSAKLDAQKDKLTAALTTATEEALSEAFKSACEVIREVQLARLEDEDPVKTHYDATMVKVREVGTKLEELEELEEA